ncbi:MAG: metal-dependent transcriptional regulator [Anaerolineales bacterium]|nr:metal-dependent transcriptional regulator [Anaerolineales bacterium]
MVSHAVEDYLKAIYELAEDTDKVSTSALTEKLGVKAPSVTGMLQKLAEAELVHYERHQGVTLTRKGRRVALEVIRHHRLIELYLSRALGYDWDQVDVEAEKLEHVISEEFEDRIAAFLGEPTHDPHGDPIPTKDGAMADYSRTPLTDVAAGATTRVARVSDDDPALLRYLGELGMVPGALVTVTSRAPFSGPMHVRVGGVDEASHALGREVTDQVFVEHHSPD